MCHTLRNNAMINNLHERRLRLIYSDKKSSYESLLEKDGLVSICHRNIHTLAMKMYKVKSGYRSKIFSNLFNQREIRHYNLRRHPEFRIRLTRTVYHGSESILYLGPKIWDILPASFKEAVLLNVKWVPQRIACPCRLCQNCIPGVGLVESLS